jgi:predicted transport protein
VYDGTFLDYGLKASGTSRLYVEAKAIGENLADKKFVAQAVNYANNDGVVWCVLTNGLIWRVFKTNETATMDKKLLFEIDISDETQLAADAAKLMRLISHQSVVEGALDRYGERVFTDGRVRAALTALAVDPPTAWIDALGLHLGHPPVPLDALRRSLARIFDAPASITPNKGTSSASPSGLPDVGPPQPPQAAKGQEYSLDHHLGNKSALIDELFTAVNSFGLALGADVTRRVRKKYIGYFRGKKSFFTVELQKQRVWIYLSLTINTAQPWHPEVMRDTKNIGHFGMGDIEYSLTGPDQLDEVTALIKVAYEKSPHS